jgi:hypothetical protein
MADLRLPCSLGRCSGSPCDQPTPRAKACSEPLRRAFANVERAGRITHRCVPIHRVHLEERQGSPRLLGHPLTGMPRSITPSETSIPRPLSATTLRPSRIEALSASEMRVSRPISRGLPACLPTLHRACYQSRCKADYRPVGLPLWPGGFRTLWMTLQTSERYRLLSSQWSSMAWSLPNSRQCINKKAPQIRLC